jgi:hypothetical protein
MKSNDDEGREDVFACSPTELPHGGAARSGFEPETVRVM